MMSRLLTASNRSACTATFETASSNLKIKKLVCKILYQIAYFSKLVQAVGGFHFCFHTLIYLHRFEMCQSATRHPMIFKNRNLRTVRTNNAFFNQCQRPSIPLRCETSNIYLYTRCAKLALAPIVIDVCHTCLVYAI